MTKNIMQKFLPRSPNVLNIVSILSLISSFFIFYVILHFVYNVDLKNPIFMYGAQKYSDIIVGGITWSDYYKSFDYIAVCLFLLIFFIVWVTLVNLINRFPSIYQKAKKGENTDKGHVVASLIIIGYLAYSIGLWLMTRTFPKFQISIIFLIAAIWFVLQLKSLADRNPQTMYEFSDRFISFLLGVFFTFFSVIGIMGVVKALDANFLLSDISVATTIALYSVIFVAALGLFMLLAYDKVSNKQWARFVYFAQLPTPLLLIIFVQGIYQQNDTTVRNNIPLFTTSLITLISLLGFWFNLRGLTKSLKLKKYLPLDRLILWPSVVSISCFLAYSIPAYSAFAWDDYHLGEAILPWHQMFEYNQTMYSGFVPQHGLMDVLYSGINSIMFYGTASSFPLAFSFLAVAAAGLSSYLLCRLVGTVWGLVLSIVMFPLSDRFFLVLPIIITLSFPQLVARPLIWIASWTILSFLNIFYSTSAGMALTVSTLPFAVFMVYAIITNNHYKGIRSINRKIALVFIVITAVLIWLLVPSTIGLLKFILDNGSMNTLGYGIGLFQYHGISEWFSSPKIFAREAFRIGCWLLGALALWHLFIRNLITRNRNIEENFTKPVSIVSLTATIFVIALIPYTMGRIDPYGPSRTGFASILLIGTLLPLALVLGSDLRHSSFLTVAIIGLLLGVKSAFNLNYSLSYQNPLYLPQRAVETISVPSDAKFIMGEEIGLPNLGDIFIQSPKLEEIENLKKISDLVLKDEETFFDLTNRSALYFVLNKRDPGYYLSDYHTASYGLQERMINALEKDIPTLVWIGPRISHDGGPSSLRSYRVYRWLMKQNYHYYEQDGLQFLIRDDRYREHGLKDMTDEYALSGITKIFHQKDLQSIPISWGRNIRNLENRFQMSDIPVVPDYMNDIAIDATGWLRVKGPDPYVVWKLPRFLDGSKFDFVTLRIECHQNDSTQFRGQVFWAQPRNIFSEDQSFRFNVKSGDLLIPLGSHPRWLKSAQIDRFRFDIDDYQNCSVFKVDSPKFKSLIH